MLDSKLKNVCNAVFQWCNRASVQYDIVYDEDDTQGVLIFKRYQTKIPSLLYAIRENLVGLHLRQVPVRAGTIILMSIKAINEHDFATSLGVLRMMTDFSYKVCRIFDGELTEEELPEVPTISVKEKLMQSAQKMWDESQYKYSGNSYKRSGSLYGFKNSRVKGHGDGEEPDAASAEDGPEDDKEENVIKEKPKVEYRIQLNDILSELAPPGGAVGLQGLGAEHQPGDLFKRFAQAMTALGQALHLGASLQDLLKNQGISWKKSEDGQAVIFYVKNAATNAPQPIARVGYQTLGKPQEFQQQLMSVLDIAKGQAPGTESQKYQEAQDAQKQMRDLATQFAPPQEGQGAPPGSGQGVAPPTPGPAAPAIPAAPAVPAAPVKPAAKPGLGPKPIGKPTAKPATKSMSKPVARPAAKPGLMNHTP